jgi:DNA-binding winged helix-turn-helix (wHTH) protein
MTFRFGNLTLDSESRALLREGKPVPISPKAFKLLQVLLESRPRAIPKAELHQRLWPDTVVSDVNLPTLIAEIRSPRGERRARAEFIRTVYACGYAFSGAASVTRRDGARRARATRSSASCEASARSRSRRARTCSGAVDSVWIDAQGVSRPARA